MLMGIENRQPLNKLGNEQRTGKSFHRSTVKIILKSVLTLYVLNFKNF